MNLRCFPPSSSWIWMIFPKFQSNVTSIVHWQGALKYQSVLNNTSIISSLNVSGHTTLNNNESVQCSGFWAKLQHADRPTGLGPGSQVTCRSNSFLCNASVFDVWGAEALEVRITLQDLFSWNGIFCLQWLLLIWIGIKYRLQLWLAVWSYPHFWCCVFAIFDRKRTPYGAFG